jgi:hypothetical protein
MATMPPSCDLAIWRVEDFHLAWKQGCRVEQLQLETRQRLEKALVLYAGVAVRIVQLRDLARREPTAPCTEVLSEDEWQALRAHMTGTTPTMATSVPTIEEVTPLDRTSGRPPAS